MSKRTSPETFQKLAEMGCTIERRGRAPHLRVLYEGKLVGTVSGSPSDWRSGLNTISSIRRGIRQLQERQAQRQEASS